MTSRRSPSLALLGLAILPMLALAGCSSAAPASPASHAAEAASHASSSTPSRAKGTPITTGKQLCTLASVQEATATLKTAKPFTQTFPQSTNDGPMCAYSGDVLVPSVTVTLIGPEDGGIKDGRANGLPLTVVPGLGRQAGVNDTELDVVLDATHWLQVINVDAKDPISHDDLIAFAKLLVSRY
jgi:hypothetical protein